jgi:hypothetical protein
LGLISELAYEVSAVLAQIQYQALVTAKRRQGSLDLMLESADKLQEFKTEIGTLDAETS